MSEERGDQVARRTGRLWLGCAVWAYRGWVGEFYPERTTQKEMLGRYVERLTAVEGNTTFYAIPSKETVSAWADAMPEGFKFCAKLNKEITHREHLSHGLHEARIFGKTMMAFGDRLGPLLVQFPPRLGPARLDELEAFLRWWPRGRLPIAVELRHEAWWREPVASRVLDLFGELGVGRVILDTRPIYDGDDDPQASSARPKPKVPMVPYVTASFALVRFIGHPRPERARPYLEEWAKRVHRWLEEGKDVYFFAHCPMEERSPHYARTLYRLLEERGAPIGPLPWDTARDDERQGALF